MSDLTKAQAEVLEKMERGSLYADTRGWWLCLQPGDVTARWLVCQTVRRPTGDVLKKRRFIKYCNNYLGNRTYIITPSGRKALKKWQVKHDPQRD